MTLEKNQTGGEGTVLTVTSMMMRNKLMMSMLTQSKTKGNLAHRGSLYVM